MNSSDQNPKVPLWVFFTTDAALLLAAWLIADRGGRPLSDTSVLAIVACVITGALVALVPLIIHVERQKNETLDERQQALEALAQTVSSSAEQISIAAGGLHEIAELAHKNLRQAEQLPHRLQEKIAEFQAQLANADAADKEELEREVAALRSTDTERLESVCDKISRAGTDFAKLETATQRNLAAASEALNKLSLGTAGAIGKAQAAAEQALAHARVEAARHLGEAAGHGIHALESAKSAALADIDARMAAAGAMLAEQIARDTTAKLARAMTALDESVARLESLARSRPVPSAAVVAESAQGTHRPEIPAAATSEPAAEIPPATEAVAPARRTRKPRRDETAAEPISPAPSVPAASPINPTPEVAPPAAGTAAAPPIEFHAGAASNNGDGDSPPPAAPIERIAPEPATAGTPVDERSRQPPAVHRKWTPKPATETEPDLGLSIDEGLPPSGVIERVLSSDGATRLVVTAYIGIGNRLFIRGDGPGLTWEKGVPLNFVSIGKWRWETNDASAPIQFKLLKNDEQECAALGSQTLDPGHQQEVTATF